MSFLIDVICEILSKWVKENTKGILILFLSLSFFPFEVRAEEMTHERAKIVAGRILKSVTKLLKEQSAKASECSKLPDNGTSDYECGYAYRTVNTLNDLVNEATKEKE